MYRGLIIAAFLICLGLTSTIAAQDSSKRTQELIAALDKTKYKSKEKRGFKVEVYVDVKNEAVAKADPRDYAGTYQDGMNMNLLDLKVGADGRAEASGFDSDENGVKTNFNLRDARVSGALLTGTKVYSDGRTEKFEAVFANRTTAAGTSPTKIEERETEYGLGFIQTHAEWTNRVFLTKK